MKQPNRLGDALYNFSKTRRFKLLVFGVLILLLFWFVLSLRAIFVPVLIGGLIAYVLEPLVKLIRALKVSRLVSILIIYFVMFVFSIMIIAATYYGVIKEAEQIVSSIESDTYEMVEVVGSKKLVFAKSEKGEKILELDHNDNGTFDEGYRAELKNKLSLWVTDWNEYAPKSMEVTQNEIQEMVLATFESADKKNKKKISVFKFLYSKLEEGAGGILYFVTTLVMIPIYAFLLQRMVPQMSEKIPGLVPEVFRARTITIFGKINKQLSAFFRGKLLVCFLKGLLTYVGLEMIGVQYAFFIGFLAGALSIVPYLGAIIGFLLAFMLTTLDKGGEHLLSITILFIVMEVVEFGLHLVIFGKEVGVHPLAFILSLFIGGSLFGVFGVIMAVPLISITTILWKEFMVPLLEDLSAPVNMNRDEVETK